MTDVPSWLNTMRVLTGTKEAPGAADNPVIVGMAQAIADHYPEMQEYCDQYQHDSTAWCGLAAAYCLAMNGIKPPFGKTDTDRFLWAQSFADDPGLVEIDQPRLGCIVVLTREGGGHVTFYESSTNGSYNCRGGNQSDSVNVAPQDKDNVLALMWPAGEPLPPAERRELEAGDSGADVAHVQTVLGIPADGEFGALTEAAVQGFQAAMNLAIDGIVGEQTWDALDALETRVKTGNEGLARDQIDAIVAKAQASPLMRYSWRDRGVAPAGYIPGMCLSFAQALLWLDGGFSVAVPMAQADRKQPDTDALSWYGAEMTAKGWSNALAGADTLRHLFVLMIGLGMRESSGRYCEGRDMSASNVQPDTAEAGLFQTSWNIASASPEIEKLFDGYLIDPNGFLREHQPGVTPKPDELLNYGKGAEGTQYQWLAKYCPAFATMVTAIGLRLRRQHWGPINRKEVELVSDAERLLQDVQAIVESGEPAPEPPEPPAETAEVAITIEASGPVRVTINGQPYG